MKKEDHWLLTKTVFRAEYKEVHKWLDSTFIEWIDSPYSPFNHWLKYHHIEAINTHYPNDLKRKYVAYFHVVCDITSRWGINYLPENEYELRKFLTRKGVILI